MKLKKKKKTALSLKIKKVINIFYFIFTSLQKSRITHATSVNVFFLFESYSLKKYSFFTTQTSNLFI